MSKTPSKTINIGDRFGHLVVVKQISKPTNSSVRGKFYECLCDCGEVTISYTSQLNSGHKKSCGHCKKNNKIGKKYGKLTVIEVDETKLKGKIYFNCICDCGNLTSVASNNLISGNTTSCGKCNWYSLEIDKTYNYIKILKDKGTSANNKQHIYECLCLRCGKIFDTNQISSIVNGNKKSCGCLQKKPDRVIQKGERFGKLTVLQENEKRTSNQGVIWDCICDCGKQIQVSTGSLRSGNTKSCGCYAKEKGKEMGKHNIHHINPNAFAKNSYDLSGEYGIGYSLDKTSYFIFDKEDYELIKDYYWIEKQDDNYKYWYAQTDEGILRLHRLIMHCTDPNKVVDHIHHKVYDNRKKELRICERYQNSINSKTYSNNTSGRKGVYWDKNRKKWLAMITTNKKTKHLGRFDSFEEAVLARENAEKIYHKEFHYEE